SRPTGRMASCTLRDGGLPGAAVVPTLFDLFSLAGTVAWPSAPLSWISAAFAREGPKSGDANTVISSNVFAREPGTNILPVREKPLRSLIFSLHEWACHCDTTSNSA